jgi:hypothetical protein
VKKYVVWFFLFFLISVAVNVHHEIHPDGPAADSRQQNIPVPSDETPLTNHDSSKPYNDPENWWGLGFVYFGWPAGTTIWALFITFLVIAEQTMETRKAAQAALLSAQAVINAGRAWVAFSINYASDSAYNISVRNHGNTPARIHYMYSPRSIVFPGEELPAKPVYPSDPEEDFEYMLFPNEERFLEKLDILFFTRKHGFDWEEVRTGVRCMQLICCLRYTDALSPEIRETRIAFRHDIQKRHWRTVGGTEYNRTT